MRQSATNMYPGFAITSLTVYRFLIASAAVASKALNDVFWTNQTYARIGGVGLTELAMLELEFFSGLNGKLSLALKA